MKRLIKPRFFNFIINKETGCWIWQGGLSDGYGRIYTNGKRYKAHRFVYELLVEKISEDKELDHLCRNRSCVNPHHLEIVNHRVNILRGVGPTAINSHKITCIHGHNNLYKVGNRRRCRECRRILDASEKRKKWRKMYLEKHTK